MPFKTPNDQQQILVLGQNGSGKSVAAVWHLSLRDFEHEQWIVINHKHDELVDAIPGAKFMKLDERPPKLKGNPGIYIYHPIPGVDDAAVTDLMFWVYARGHCGVYIDECYMINPRDPGLTALYTQGRSKHIPMITLSQRPSLISRFAISEAKFYQVFFLADERDRKLVNAFIPGVDLSSLMEMRVDKSGRTSERELPEYHSVYYDGRNLLVMTPVPTDDEILAVFEEKLKPRGLFSTNSSGRRFL